MYIPKHEFKHSIKHIGYLPQFYARGVSSLKPVADATQVEPWYAAVDPGYKEIPVELTHGWIETTYESLKKQVMLFDHPYPQELPVQAVWAKNQVQDMLDYFGVRSKVIPLWDIEWNLSSSPGFFLNKQYKDKREYFKHEYEDAELYLQLAHKINATPLLVAVGKSEYQKKKKIQEENQRCFEVNPVTETAMQLSCCQYFNKKMYEQWEVLPIKIGIDFQKGGFTKFMQKLVNKLVVQGDVTKYDKHFCTVLRMLCKAIRIGLYEGPNAQEFLLKMEHIYKNSTQPYVVLPWGQIIQILVGMMSGDGNTSSDNSLAHTILLFSFLKEHEEFVCEVLGIKELTWRNILRFMELAIYADDHDNGFPTLLAPILGFKERCRFYNLFGFNLKEEDDLVKVGPEGTTFLGGKCIIWNNQLVPEYNEGRIWSSLTQRGNVLSPKQYFMKACSLLLLSTFTKSFPIIRNLIFRMIENFNRTLPGWFEEEIADKQFNDPDVVIAFEPLSAFPYVPSFGDAVQFWLGWECGSALGKHFAANKNISRVETLYDI